VEAYASGLDAFVVGILAPTVSGNVGVGGATLSYSMGAPQSTIADVTGMYSFAVPYNWSGTVTPSKTNYAFSPASRPYPNVTSDQTGQDYIATLVLPMPIERVSPAFGAEVCETPEVGVDLLLTNSLRTNGSFDPSKITLKLDGTDVTGSASSLQTMTSPASLGSVFYTPLTVLALGVHEVELTYATASGPLTLQWSFTVAAIPCPTGGTHASELEKTSPSSAPDVPSADRRVIDIP
jgi:hypothetical protein